MADLEIKMDYGGCNELRNDPSVQAMLLGMAQDIAAQATSSGCTCGAMVMSGQKRARARVATTNENAARNNYAHNTLLKSMGAGRR